MSKKLCVYDFDGTLFNSPCNTPEMLAQYERETGMPWVINSSNRSALVEKFGELPKRRSGWWGRGETLMPPLVPDPVPEHMWNRAVVDSFLKSKENPNERTLLLTGRHKGIRKHVLRILHQGGLLKTLGAEQDYEQADEGVIAHFLTERGPVTKFPIPNETLPWKMWIIKQYFEVDPSLTSIEFWEDREEHIPHFQKIDHYIGLHGMEVKVNHVQIA